MSNQMSSTAMEPDGKKQREEVRRILAAVKSELSRGLQDGEDIWAARPICRLNEVFSRALQENKKCPNQ